MKKYLIVILYIFIAPGFNPTTAQFKNLKALKSEAKLTEKEM